MTEDLPSSVSEPRRPGPVTARTIQLMRRAEEVFHQVADLPVAERESRARELASGDETVLGIVLDLLREDEGGAHGLIQQSVNASVDAAAGVTDFEIVEVLPEIERIGPYRITDHIGEGGMGVVYKGLRDDEFQKVVAIKVVKRGMDTSAVLDRFVQERQILASFDHPNIAGLLDGGQTPDGRPYLVMDYVGGQSLTEFVQSQNPSTAKRLRLFVLLCQAVDYAHRRLVVHRDIKPSNIRVTEAGAPVLLDFGIAKMLEPGASVTRTGLLPALTPQYAAPEQVLGGPITVATDVYALGLVLYELLTDRRAQAIDSLSHSAIERVVCRQDPPSVTLSRPGLARDLDAIVSMALRKEPERRYPSAARLADDVERFLNGYPVLARTGSRTYRLNKFVGRHWRGVAMASVVTVGTVVASTALVRFARNAEREKEAAEQVSEFLQEVFLAAEVNASRTTPLTAREVLDAGVGMVREKKDMQPPVRANILETLARVYSNLGQDAKSADLLVEALSLRRSLGSEVNTAETLGFLGSVRANLGDMRGAADLLRQSLQIQERLLGAAHPQVARLHNDLGVTLWRLGECSESRRHLSAAMVWAKSNDQEVLVPTVMNNIALCDTLMSDYDQAEKMLGEAVRLEAKTRNAPGLRKKRADGLPTFEENRARAWAEKARFGEAEEALAAAVAQRRLAQGESHPDLARALTHQVRVFLEVGDLRGAQKAQHEAAAIRASLPPGALKATDVHSAGLVELARGDGKTAEASLRIAIDMFRQFMDPYHHDAIAALSDLGAALALQSRWGEAAAAQEEAYRLLSRNYGPDHALAGLIKSRIAVVDLRKGAFAEALGGSDEALRVLTRRHGPDHPRVAAALMTKARALFALQRSAEALICARDALRIGSLKLRKESPDIAEAQTLVARLTVARAR